MPLWFNFVFAFVSTFTDLLAVLVPGRLPDASNTGHLHPAANGNIHTQRHPAARRDPIGDGYSVANIDQHTNRHAYRYRATRDAQPDTY